MVATSIAFMFLFSLSRFKDIGPLAVLRRTRIIVSIASNFDCNTSDTFCSGFGGCRRLDSSLLAATVSRPAPFSSAPPSSDGLALPEIFLGGVAAHFASLDQIKDGDKVG